jgi:hypothetical protein
MPTKQKKESKEQKKRIISKGQKGHTSQFTEQHRRATAVPQKISLHTSN